MATPPTRNDFRRFDYSYTKSLPKRIRLKDNTPSTFRPTLSTPIFINYLGINLTGDVLGTESGVGINFPSYTENILFNNEVYKDSILTVTPLSYVHNSLWYFEDNFVSESNSFQQVVTGAGTYNFRREFYTNKKLLSAQTYALTSHDFDSLELSLSTDTPSYTALLGDWDPRLYSTYAVQIEYLMGSGSYEFYDIPEPSLISININQGRLLDNQVHYMIDFGDDFEFTKWTGDYYNAVSWPAGDPTLTDKTPLTSKIERHVAWQRPFRWSTVKSYNSLTSSLTHRFTFLQPFTGTKTITLSTIRNDGTGVNITTLPYSVRIDEPYWYSQSLSSINTTWSIVSSTPNPLDEFPGLSGVTFSYDDQDASDPYLHIDLTRDTESFRPGALAYRNSLNTDMPTTVFYAQDDETNEKVRNKYRLINDIKTSSPSWNTDWFLYEHRDILNFSGTSFSGIGVPRDNTCTLIAPKFVVSANHFGGIQVGDSLSFLDHDTGALITSKVVGKRGIRGSFDGIMYKLEDDVTSLGNVKVYKLPLFENPVPPARFGGIYRGGNTSLGKFRKEEFTGVGGYSGADYSEGCEYAGLGATEGGALSRAVMRDEDGNVVYDSRGELVLEDYYEVVPGIGDIFYTSLQGLSSNFSDKKMGLPQNTLRIGDSSCPWFIIHGNDILLHRTFTFSNGAGQSYSTAYDHTILQNNMDALGNTEGYTLSTVRLS